MLTDGSFRKTVSNEEVHFEDGYIKIPDKPGLGMDLNEDVILSHPYKPRNLRHYKGTVTDIRSKNDTVYYFKELEDKNMYKADIIEKEGLIVIFRKVPPEKIENVMKALYDGGVRIVEIAFDPSDENTIQKRLNS
ncbi:MAG: hypothetical protein L6V93_02000 [Clostridiales bacterium]|nr:MAG: hypothetical protein L6V93_02000 [Clostridiales bacterium]